MSTTTMLPIIGALERAQKRLQDEAHATDDIAVATFAEGDAEAIGDAIGLLVTTGQPTAAWRTADCYPSIIAPAVAEAERIEAGGEIKANELAALLRFNADLVADYRSALEDERADNGRLKKDCDQMVERLSRLEYHLRDGMLREVMDKLADYAGPVGHEDLDDPPRDPYPDPPVEPTANGRTRKP